MFVFLQTQLCRGSNRQVSGFPKEGRDHQSHDPRLHRVHYVVQNKVSHSLHCFVNKASRSSQLLRLVVVFFFAGSAIHFENGWVYRTPLQQLSKEKWGTHRKGRVGEGKRGEEGMRVLSVHVKITSAEHPTFYSVQKYTFDAFPCVLQPNTFVEWPNKSENIQTSVYLKPPIA